MLNVMEMPKPFGHPPEAKAAALPAPATGVSPKAAQ